MNQLKKLFEDTLFVAYTLFNSTKYAEVILKKWNLFCKDIVQDKSKIGNSLHNSLSFQRLMKWVSSKDIEGVTAFEVVANIEEYRVELLSLLAPDIQDEFKIDVSSSLNPSLPSIEDESYIEQSSADFMYHLRETISQNKFTYNNEMETMVYQLSDKFNTLTVLSSHFDEDIKLQSQAEINRWSDLVSSALNSMDDFTADCLDIVTYLWTQNAKSEKESIHFNYEQVLEMCEMGREKNGKIYYRVEDRLKVMKRLAALASIFIYVNDKNEIVVVNDDIDETSLKYKKQKIRRLFSMDEIILAKDARTDELLGIESCNIAPGSFLSKYLFGSQKLTALLSKKALEYNSYTHRYHKRLTRYLSWQWRIRQTYNNLYRPFKIGDEKGLLKVMGINIESYRPVRIREMFEKVLDDLARDNVIKGWDYSPSVDEEQFESHSWFRDYWLNLSVTISPPDELVHMQRELIGAQQRVEPLLEMEVLEEPVKQKKETSSVTVDYISYFKEKVLEYKESQNTSLREIAKETEVSYSCLSRLCNGKTQRLSEENRTKLNKWLERQRVIEMI